MEKDSTKEEKEEGEKGMGHRGTHGIITAIITGGIREEEKGNTRREREKGDTKEEVPGCIGLMGMQRWRIKEGGNNRGNREDINNQDNSST